MGAIMKVDRNRFREIEAIALCLALLPVLAATAVKFFHRARKDLRFPNKNDMWE